MNSKRISKKLASCVCCERPMRSIHINNVHRYRRYRYTHTHTPYYVSSLENQNAYYIQLVYNSQKAVYFAYQIQCMDDF